MTGVNNSNTISKVFVTQNMGFDYSDAEQNFGALVYMTDRKDKAIFGIGSKIRKCLWDNAFCDDDFLLANGSPAVMMLAAHHAMSHVDKVLKVLQWDRDAQHYKIIELRK